MNIERQIEIRNEIESNIDVNINEMEEFLDSGLGVLELELCKILSSTPKELGNYRKSDPKGIEFIETTIIWRCKKEKELYGNETIR